MRDFQVTSMCAENRHDLCLGYYGDKDGNYTCGCHCHKKIVDNNLPVSRDWVINRDLKEIK